MLRLRLHHIYSIGFTHDDCDRNLKIVIFFIVDLAESCQVVPIITRSKSFEKKCWCKLRLAYTAAIIALS